MEFVSLRSYSDAYPCHSGTAKHPNMNVETQIPLELESNNIRVECWIPNAGFCVPIFSMVNTFSSYISYKECTGVRSSSQIMKNVMD